MPRPKVIDLFAGAGGSSLGARQAGCEIVYAANHCVDAIALHSKNHPSTLHVCQDLQQADFYTVPDADILIASPSCKAHSNANTGGGRHKGGRARCRNADADRNTAWAVPTCLEATGIELAIVENVTKFLRWKGYRHWKGYIQDLGYALHEHVIDCARLGVPQHRERVFITIAKGRTPIKLDFPRRPLQPIGPLLLLDGPGNWKPVRTRNKPIRDRVARARARMPTGVILSHYVTDDVGHSIAEPIKCVTAQHQWAIVRPSPRGDEIRMFNSREYARAMGFPDEYHTLGKVRTDAVLFGNAVPPTAMRDAMEDLLRQAG